VHSDLLLFGIVSFGSDILKGDILLIKTKTKVKKSLGSAEYNSKLATSRLGSKNQKPNSLAITFIYFDHLTEYIHFLKK